MAGIPVYDPSNELARGLDVPQGGAEAFGNAGRHVAAELRMAGEGIRSALDTYGQHEDIQQTSDLTTGFTNKEPQWREAWKQEVANNPKADPSQFFSDRVAPDMDKLGEIATTQKARAHFADLRSQVGLGLLTQWQAEKNQLDSDNAYSAGNDAYRQAGIVVHDNPAALPSQMSIAHTKVDGLLSAAGVPAAKKAEHFREQDAALADQALDGLASKAEIGAMKPDQIDTTLAMIRDPASPFHTLPSAKGYAAAEDRLIAAKNTQGDIQSYALSAHGEDALRSIAQNDQSVPQSRQVVQYLIEHPTGASATERAKSSEEWSVKLAHADATAKATQSTAGMNRDQLVQIERTKPVSPSEEQSALVETATTQRKAMDGDPANTLIDRSPTVKNAAVAFTSNPTPQTWATYRTASAALQRQYNPARVPRLVPQGMHDQIAQDMQGITQDANGATQAGGTLSKWAGITGSDWPNVAEELRATHVINNDQYAAGELYGKNGQGGLTNALLQSSTMTNDQRHMLHGIEIGPAKTAAAQAFDGFNKTFANIPNSQGFIEAQTDALAHLIQTKGLNPKDLDVNDPKDPIMQMAHDMVLDEFNIVGDTLRVPSKQNADAIEAGTVRAQGNIDHPGKDPHWYTTPDGGGATLYPEPGASAPIAVNGKPLTLTWKQLATLGQQ